MDRTNVSTPSDVEDELSHRASGQDQRIDAFRPRADLMDDDVFDLVQLLILLWVRQAALIRFVEGQSKAELDSQRLVSKPLFRGGVQPDDEWGVVVCRFDHAPSVLIRVDWGERTDVLLPTVTSRHRTAFL